MGSQNWGADHSTHALKKDCNWLQFINFKLDIDPIQEKEMTRLRHANKVDELLRTQSRFLQITDSEVSGIFLLLSIKLYPKSKFIMHGLYLISTFVFFCHD